MPICSTRSSTRPSQVVSGFEPVMPTTYSDQLSQEEINDLVEYIKSLS